MRKPLKGSLLSGLVFPGYGQFVMKGTDEVKYFIMTNAKKSILNKREEA